MSLKDAFLRRLALRENVSVGPGFHVGPRSVLWAPRALTVGRDVYIGKNVTIEVDGEIGDGTLIANNVGIVGRSDHRTDQVGVPIRHATWVGDDPVQQSLPTRIGADVWVGFGAIILSGVTIGDSSLIAAGALVTKSIPNNSIAVGSPATVSRNRFSDADYDAHWGALRADGYSPSIRTGYHS